MIAPYIRLGVALGIVIASGVLLTAQSVESSLFAGVVADVERMGQDSNPARRVVLESILTQRDIPFAAESFSIDAREDYPRIEGTNLVVTLGSGERDIDVASHGDIVVGAHYDAAWLSDGSLSRGAIDNASSSIVLTRLADTLQQEALRHRVRLVFFDMEEIGLFGSRSFIGTHGADTIESAVNLDVNGYGDRVFFGPSSAEGNEGPYQLFRETCFEENLSCQEFEQYPNSDHRSFQIAGIPNISISVLPSVETHQFWLFLNSGEGVSVFREGFLPRVLRTIHTPNDTSAAIEASAMELSYRAVLGLVRRLDRVVD